MEIYNQKSLYVSQETQGRVNCGHVQAERVKIEKYITNEDQYLKLIKDELVVKYGDEADKRLRADFDKTEKAIEMQAIIYLILLD